MELNKFHLVGERITLRPVTPDDAHAIWAMDVKDQTEIMKWERGTWASEEKIRECAEKRISLYVISLGDKVIGTINVWNFDERLLSCKFGYGLDQDYVGHGYMTEALTLLIKELFRVGMVRIAIQTLADNVRSINLAKRCGFQEEGIARKNEFIGSRGEYCDSVIMSIVNDENATKHAKVLMESPAEHQKITL